MFCPKCGTEYVEGITRCSDCGTALVAELPRFADSDEPLRMIHTAGPTEAPMIQELLANNRIESILQGEAAATTIPAAGDVGEVRIWVRQSDQERASELINAFFDSPNEPEEKEDTF